MYTCVLQACHSWEFREICLESKLRNFLVVLDVKKESYDEKYIDDENEKNLDKARHLKKLTVDDL